MKKVIKIIALNVIAVLTVLNFAVLNVVAAATVSVGGGEFEVGQSITIAVKLSNDTPIITADTDVSYNPSVLTLKSVSGADCTLENGTANIIDDDFTDNTKEVRTGSYKLNFIAIAEGSSTISVTTKIVDNDLKENTASASSTVRVVTPKPSSNADLASLTVDGASLSPSFKASVTDYTATVKYSVANVNIKGSVADGGATYVGGGSWDLDVGENVRTLTVTAADGSKKSYTVTVKRMTEEETAAAEEDARNANPLLVIIDGIDYTIVNDYSEFKLPTGYTQGTALRKETEVAVLNDDYGEYQLYCLADPSGATAFYTRNDNDVFTRVNYITIGSKLYIVEDPYFEGIIPDGYEIAERTIDDIVIDAYSYSDENLKDFYIVKCYIDGKHGFYSFDTVERTMQRAVQFEMAIEARNSNADAEDVVQTSSGRLAWFKNMNRTGKLLFIGIIFAGMLFIALAIILIVKIASSGKKDIEEEPPMIMPQDNEFILHDETYEESFDEPQPIQPEDEQPKD